MQEWQGHKLKGKIKCKDAHIKIKKLETKYEQQRIDQLQDRSDIGRLQRTNGGKALQRSPRGVENRRETINKINPIKSEEEDSKNAKVFVLNYAGHDLTDAKRYGELIYLTTGDLNVFNIDRMHFTISQELMNNDFNINKDYICITGSPIVAFVVRGILEEFKTFRRLEKFKALLWDAKYKRYVLKFI